MALCNRFSTKITTKRRGTRSTGGKRDGATSRDAERRCRSFGGGKAEGGKKPLAKSGERAAGATWGRQRLKALRGSAADPLASGRGVCV